MTADLPYILRAAPREPSAETLARKGQACRVTGRSHARPGETPLLAFGTPARPRFNSVRMEFADGFSIVTSGNFIRRAAP